MPRVMLCQPSSVEKSADDSLQNFECKYDQQRMTKGPPHSQIGPPHHREQAPTKGEAEEKEAEATKASEPKLPAGMAVGAVHFQTEIVPPFPTSLAVCHPHDRPSLVAPV
jgi:hypothetical protein